MERTSSSRPRATAPLHDHTVVDQGIEVYREAGVEYVSNRMDRTWPTGLDTQVFAVEVLEKVAARTEDPEDLEHGSYYIYTHPDEFTLLNYKSEDIACPEKRWCLDYPEDYEFSRRSMSGFTRSTRSSPPTMFWNY